MRDPIWDKPQVFDPNRIGEINFKEGRHSASPTGEVVFPRTERARLLHYKYLGADYLLRRHAELRARFPAADFERGWGYQYLWDEQKNIDELQRVRAAAVRVVRSSRATRTGVRWKTIDGVRIVRLKKVVNDRGHLMEVQRADDDHFLGFGQAYVTCTLPGVIKAWYRHHQQIDQIALVRGTATVVLFDGRPHSPSAAGLWSAHSATNVRRWSRFRRASGMAFRPAVPTRCFSCI